MQGGRASIGGLSVPGSAHAGGHQVSARCAPSGPTVMALYLVFAAFSFGFWGYFRYRRPRSEAELAEEGDYGVR